jgi:hypothetical protein
MARDPPFGGAVRTNSVGVRGVVLFAVVVLAHSQRAARQRWLSPRLRRCPRRSTAGLGRGRVPRSVLAGQHEHRNLPRGPGLGFAELRILRGQLRPQLGAGGVVELFRQYRQCLGAHLDFDPGLGLEVVVLVWVGWRSSIGGPDREAVLSSTGVGDRRDALDPGFRADVVDENQRDARPWPADPSPSRAELFNDLRVVVVGPARSRVRQDVLRVAEATQPDLARRAVLSLCACFGSCLLAVAYVACRAQPGAGFPPAGRTGSGLTTVSCGRGVLVVPMEP